MLSKTLLFFLDNQIHGAFSGTSLNIAYLETTTCKILNTNPPH